MKLTIMYLFLTCCAFPITQCSQLTELTPIKQQASPYPKLNEFSRKELVEQTKDLPDRIGFCQLNPEKQENLKHLFYPDGRWKQCDMEMSCLKMLYTIGCTCEKPCTYITACGCIGLGVTGGILGSSACECTKCGLAAIMPTSLVIGIPSIIAICFGVNHLYNKKSKQASCNLDYITDPKNWPDPAASSEHTHDSSWLDQDYDYD